MGAPRFLDDAGLAAACRMTVSRGLGGAKLKNGVVFEFELFTCIMDDIMFPLLDVSCTSWTVRTPLCTVHHLCTTYYVDDIPLTLYHSRVFHLLSNDNIPVQEAVVLFAGVLRQRLRSSQ